MLAELAVAGLLAFRSDVSHLIGEQEKHATIWKFNVRHTIKDTLTATVWTDGTWGGLGSPVDVAIRVKDPQSGAKPIKATVTFHVFLIDDQGRAKQVRERTVSPTWERLVIAKGYYEVEVHQSGQRHESDKPYSGEVGTWEVIVADALGIFVPKGGKALECGRYVVNVTVSLDEQRVVTVTDLPFEVSLKNIEVAPRAERDGSPRSASRLHGVA